MQAARGASLTSDHTSSTRRRPLWLLLAVAALVVALDQVAKVLAVTQLTDGQVVRVVGDVLRLRLVRNSGAAFSIGTDMTVVLTIVAIAVVVVILRVSRRLASVPWAIALGGFLGGALGNLVDRMFRAPSPLHGHVVDFLEVPRWPVFNFADAAIVGAAVLVAWLSFRGVAYDAGASPDSGASTEAAGAAEPTEPAGPTAEPAGPTARSARSTDEDAP
ncbi:MAG TPA: signal peptidase II [Jiangellaceae bacterium]